MEVFLVFVLRKPGQPIMGFYLKAENGSPDDVNPISIIQGHVDDQKVEVLTSRPVMIGIEGKNFMMREHILQDNYTNVYIVYDARLSDGETYSHGLRLKPSEIEAGGGVDPKPGWGLRLSEETLSGCRRMALEIFARTQQSISGGKRNELNSNE